MKIPSRKFYLNHLTEFSLYTQSKSWIDWYADVAKLKGIRTAKILKKYQGEDAKLLDLGCGIGLSLAILAQEFPSSVGCDIDHEAVLATQKITKDLGLKVPIILYDGKKLPFEDNTFDIVTCIEVIEHAKNPDQMLKEIKRVLKPGGVFHITTANKWWPYEPHFKLLFLSYLPANIADHYVRLSGKGDSYEGIKLPSYGTFKKMIDKHFFVNDITLDIIRDYKYYSFDKERGRIVVLVGVLLQYLEIVDKKPVLGIVPLIVKWLLVRVSLGWLFIGYPKK